jgi:hypothetical protein
LIQEIHPEFFEKVQEVQENKQPQEYNPLKQKEILIQVLRLFWTRRRDQIS